MLLRCLCLLLLAAPSALAQLAPASDCQIVVLNVVPQNLRDEDKAMPGVLTSILAQQVSVDSGCRVVTQADLSEMLDFEAARLACTDAADSCLAELGSALGADRIVGGAVGTLGADMVVTARLMNVKTGVVEARAQQVAHGATEQLRQATQNVSRALFGKPLIAAEVAPAAVTTATKASSPLRWVGAGVGALGAVTLAAGGAVAVAAELGLGDRAALDKSSLTTTGRVGLIAAGAGLVIGTVGLLTFIAVE